ncbi:sulfotransferase family protein [Thiocapsa roseopersicina]|uniref:Sulfotransferase family protein n=1 Tax=Thiocapsa roseopersicina TaxID=1058 RepID=A0A1H2Y5J2_THIRO|nr:sulfotransferase [Thiocapsa roseopersicina]SDW99849.1 Sulfotransferase family protein [Thiocapsa roseopersicina]
MKLAFLIGTGRCGSTLVHEILARHPAFGFVSNLEDNLLHVNRLGRMNRRLYRSSLGWVTKKGGIRFAPSEAYRIIGREVSMIYMNSCRDLVEADVTPWLEGRFRRFFVDRADAQNVEIFLHKYTGWSRILFFHKIFPDAKFIHVVRDGRAVANSWLQMPWWNGYRGPENWLWGTLSPDLYAEWIREENSFVALAGLAWKLLIESADAAGAKLPGDRFLTLRFEDIVDNPISAFEEMLKFIGLDMSDEFVASLSRYEFSAARRRAFEQDLGPSQIACVNRVSAGTLERFGYLD